MCDRIPCEVPFCRRTARPDRVGTVWICGQHWGLVPKRYRMALSRAGRRYRKRFGDNPFWKYPGGSPLRLEAVRRVRIWERLWARCRKVAIERAVGI